MIFLTGDTHGDVTRFDMEIFPEQKEMNKNDYVIILGDFGLVWDYQKESDYEKRWLDWLDNKPFTTLFLDGNHECFSRLYHDYPIEEWHGGKVHKIRPNVIHLMRGEVYEIEGRKFFAFGGASSHDIEDGILDAEKDAEKIKEWSRDWFKMFRILNQSWWKEELPSKEEMNNGIENLEKHNWKVDYVLTHSPCASVVALLGQGIYEQDILTNYLQEIRSKLKFNKWFCGHMHINETLNYQDFILYEQIIRLL